MKPRPPQSSRQPESVQPGSQNPSRRSAMVCGICGQRFFLDETDSPPFCSERCKMVDLGRWLDERIEIPHEGGTLDQQDDQSE